MNAASPAPFLATLPPALPADAPLPWIQLVVAYTRNRVIGRDNDMPWHLPSDLAWFKRVTLGSPIIMGRKTWQSLPRRPLPGRLNVVISRDAALDAPGATVCTSLADALHAAGDAPRVCIIGGAQLFEAALPLAHEIIATEIDADIEGDTWFARLPDDQWHAVLREQQPADGGLAHDHVVYRRA